MQQRIDRLENLVTMLMTQKQETLHVEDNCQPEKDVQDREDHVPSIRTVAVPHTVGTTLVNESQSVYKTLDDWSDVLQEVRIVFMMFLEAFEIANIDIGQ
jgi:hypothetical protein